MRERGRDQIEDRTRFKIDLKLKLRLQPKLSLSPRQKLMGVLNALQEEDSSVMIVVKEKKIQKDSDIPVKQEFDKVFKFI